MPAGDQAILVSVIAFDEAAVKALLRLHKGDSAAVSGTVSLRTWSGRDGAQHTGLGVTAAAVLSVYEARRRRAAAEADTGEARAGRLAPVASVHAELRDEINRNRIGWSVPRVCGDDPLALPVRPVVAWAFHACAGMTRNHRSACGCRQSVPRVLENESRTVPKGAAMMHLKLIAIAALALSLFAAPASLLAQAAHSAPPPASHHAAAPAADRCPCPMCPMAAMMGSPRSPTAAPAADPVTGS